MNFTSYTFLFFLFAVLLLHRLFPWRLGRWVLVVASYLFYGAAHPWYCLLLFTSTAVDFVVAQRIAEAEAPGVRKRFLLVSILVNLGLLCFFKYGGFIVENLNAVTGFASLPPIPFTDLILPVGISFYTFQTMAYTIDVYRRISEPTKDFAAFALYVSFFPQLVAGPIERAHHLLPQLISKQAVTRIDWVQGVQRILWGLVKKIVVADRLGIMVNEVYADPAAASSPVLVIATLSFTFQLYLDFSAYTDIAIGSARLLGVRLTENFNWPLLARNPTEFWARWHITLTHWFRDYVFQPLGGSMRRNRMRTYLNLFILILLIGVWHGAGWTYVLFGVFHGICLVVYHALRTRTGRKKRGNLLGQEWWSRPVAIVIWGMFVNIWAVVFRAPNLSVAWEVLVGMVTAGLAWPARYNLHLFLLVILFTIHAARGLMKEPRRERDLAAPIRALFWLGLILLLVYGAVDHTEAFIYFQF